MFKDSVEVYLHFLQADLCNQFPLYRFVVKFVLLGIKYRWNVFLRRCSPRVQAKIGYPFNMDRGHIKVTNRISTW